MPTIRQNQLKIRHVRVADPQAIYQRSILAPSDLADVARRLIGDSPQEVFLLFHLTVKNTLLGYTEIARGAIDACPVDPRILFGAALTSGAVGIAVAHNHPSGNPTPSVEDRVLTERIARGAEILGLELLDHVVVTHDAYQSLAPELAARSHAPRRRHD